MSRKTPVNTLIPSIGSGPHGSQAKGSSAPLAKIDIFAGEALTSAHSDWSHPWRGAPGIDRHAFRVNPAHGRAPRHHDTPVSAGTPSIAGISDVVKEPGVFPSQTTIRNSLPTIIGFGHAGDVVTVFDGDHSIGSALVQADGTWHFSTPPLAKGTHEFFVTAVSPVSGITLVSNHLVVHMIGDTVPPAQNTATITCALDEFIDPNGVHHDNVILNGGTTLDTSPKLTGTIDVALHDGEMLAVYRDGVKVGHADVSGLGWSFQDGGLVAGDHLYTARVESAAGMPGNLSATFAVAEKALKSFAGIPVLATEDFLIFDTRAISRITSDGAPVAFDLMESVKALEKLGMTVQRYTEQGGFISIEVDWMDYAKSHPRDDVEFVSHRHVDNGKGGLDYYDTVGVPAFAYLTNKLGTWVQTGLPSDGAALQSPLPAPATSITDIYDASGDPGQARRPDGGSTSSSTFKVVGTFSEPVNSGDVLAVYRDGVRMTSTSLEGGYDRATNTWWLIDKEVPPGPHTYTARVQRMYGDQGEWSDSYSLVETILDTPRDTLAARILMNDGTLSVDVRSVAQSYTDESGTSIVLRAQLTLADKSVIVIPPALSDDGVVAFQADWARLVATHPDAKLTITMDDGTGNTGQVVDAHLLRSLATQMNHWITATPDGENTAFFDVSDRSIQIHGGPLIKTLAVSDDHQTIDLSSLTGKTVAATIMGIEKIDLGGQHNTLQIALIDVLNLGEKDLFRSDGKQQLMINGKAGDLVELANTRVAGISDGAWEQPVQTKIGGVTYDVYEHSTAHVELMVQSGVQLVQH